MRLLTYVRPPAGRYGGFFLRLWVQVKLSQVAFNENVANAQTYKRK